ncbi:DUF7639 domain-containing protein [Anatilimnocola aggregata]
MLNGLPTSSDMRRQAFQQFLHDPTESNRQILKLEYESIPSHLDCWLLGPELKDIPIRKVLADEASSQE